MNIKKLLREPQPGDYILRIFILFHMLAFSLFGLFYCFFICEPGSAGRSLALWPILMFILSVAGIIIGIKKEANVYRQRIRAYLRMNDLEEINKSTFLGLSPLEALTTGAAIGVATNLMFDRKTARGIAFLAFFLAIILWIRTRILRSELEKYYEEEEKKYNERIDNILKNLAKEASEKQPIKMLTCPNCVYPHNNKPRYLYRDTLAPGNIYRCPKCDYFVKEETI